MCQIFQQAVKFKKAEELCESNNATLISIHSDEENEFIRNYLKEQPSFPIRVWIGLKRKSSLDFIWVDKSPVDYYNWEIGQPNNLEGYEPFIETLIYKDGTWNDRIEDNLPFVCGFSCK
jgi:hypothetical protein